MFTVVELSDTPSVVVCFSPAPLCGWGADKDVRGPLEFIRVVVSSSEHREAREVREWRMCESRTFTLDPETESKGGERKGPGRQGEGQ